MIKKLFLYLISSLILFAGCVQQHKPEKSLTPEEKEALKIKKEQEETRVNKIFEDIDERNRMLKKTPDWLTAAYSSIKIKKLNDIPKEEYASYKKYLNNGDIYIIVHPGYYVFFMNDRMISSNKDIEALPQKNIIERFSDTISPSDINFRIMQEQERLLRDFLEFMSEEKKLVILILPNDYKNHLTYGYVQGLDEYARYINELTNMSESILYMESQTHDTGTMAQNELDILSSFLSETEVKRIMLGGGYLGKCLDNFYVSVTSRFKPSRVYFAPEITTISPEDGVADYIKMLTKNGKINFNGIKKYYARFDFVKIKRLSLYRIYRNP